MTVGGPERVPGRDLPRVVSLVPSATETLLALGAHVVACTRFCNQPQLAVIGGTKNPDVEAIIALRPDWVVVDTEENRREDADSLRAASVGLVVTSVRSVEDALAVVDQLAAASRTTAPQRPAVSGPDLTRPNRRAFVPIWRRPWMTIGRDTYGASLLRSLNIDLVALDDDADYPIVELNQIGALEPELVIVPSEPYSFTEAHVGELRQAVPSATIVAVDGEDLFWWGIRTPAAGRRLGECLAPVG